jgi:predicted amidohydrolase
VTDTLALAVAQPLTLTHDVAANAVAHADAIRAAAARVVVFPELSLTGYDFDTPSIGVDDPRLAPIVEACAATGSLALAGAPVDDAAGNSYIAILAVDGTGATVAYRKMHVHSSEDRRFSAGDAHAVLDVDGWRLGLAICRDTGIPSHPAEAAALGIDVYVAGVLGDRDDDAVYQERALRISKEHGVWVAFASFAGSTGAGYDDAAGCSAVRAPDGEVLAQAGAEVGEVARAVLRRS